MRRGIFVLACVLVAASADAQSNDARWEPWIGCWTLATEGVRGGDSEDGQVAPARRSSRAAEGAPRVCVSRPAGGGVRFETTVSSQAAIDRTLIADGTARPITDQECTGTELARWSKSGLRLFTSADTLCQGESEPRRVSGISLIATNGDWLDIQSVTVGDRHKIRVKRYVPDGSRPPSGRPTVTASALTIDEIVDGLATVSPVAIEAALVETRSGFNLTAQRLRELSSAGVPARIIDVMVALSYPEKFVVQRAAPASSSSGYADPFGIGYGYPYSWDSYYYGAPYYYGTPYYYAPFGYYGPLGWDGYSFVGVPSVIVGAPDGDDASSDGPGRAINRRGYTRSEPRESRPATTATDGSAGASDGGSSTASSSGSSRSGSSGSDGGSASSGRGYSGGSDSGSGRTAVPR